MENKDYIEKEQFVPDYPLQLNIKGINKLNEQMTKSICKIYINRQREGTGFFCTFLYEKKTIKALCTNNHVIGEKELKDNIKFSLNDKKEFYEIKLDNSRKIFTDKSLDVTIIELNEYETKEMNCNYLELDDDLSKEKKFLPVLYENKPIYILHYPKGNEIYHLLEKFIK